MAYFQKVRKIGGKKLDAIASGACQFLYLKNEYMI